MAESPYTEFPTAQTAIDNIAARMGDAEQAVIYREEMLAINQFVEIVREAKRRLEASEQPFYEGMQHLNEVTK